MVMKHLASIQKQFAAYGRDFNIVKVAIESDWWKKLTPEQQKQYILEHRRTKLRPEPAYVPSESNLMKRVIRDLPGPWKKQLVANGVGVNSGLHQLPDMLRSRVLKEAFEDKSVKAIVGFERGGNITQLQPAFVITPCGWKEDKFNLRAVKNKDGTQTDPSAAAFIPKERSRRGRSWRSGGYRTWTDHVTELRMSAIVDKIQDLPYTVFAVSTDPRRMELRQERSSLQAVSSRRQVEKALVAKVAKPVFDYYSSIIQQNTAKLQVASIPSFDELVSPGFTDNSRRNQEKLTAIVGRIKQAQDQLSGLSNSISSIISWHGLPGAGESYTRDWDHRKAKEFMRALKEMKTTFREDYAKAIEMKSDFAISSLTKATPDYEDAHDQMMSIEQPDIAKEILGLRDMGDDLAKTQRLTEIIHKINAIQRSSQSS
jgi:hypothetical protein